MDLNTTYMGLSLKNPVVASASPLSETLGGMKRLEDGGVAAIVMFSLFEEQIRHENEAFSHLMESGTLSFAESLSYFPEIGAYDVGPNSYLELVRQAANDLDIPVIASLNCVTSGGWIAYAKQLQEAGAAGLELNIYGLPADIEVSGADVEQRYLDILTVVKSTVSIPVALKLSPYFSSMGYMAKRLDAAGADALVLFNRFFQPDIDIKELEVQPTLPPSSAAEIYVPLLWTALLHGQLKASIGASRGVEGPVEVIKYLLAGADAVMTTSALLRKGPAYAAELVKGLEDWMEARGFESVGQMRGNMSHRNVANPRAFERANYLRVLESFKGQYG